MSVVAIILFATLLYVHKSPLRTDGSQKGKDMALVKLDKTGTVFTLTMDAGENRWNTALVDELSAALDEVEQSKGAAALVTTGASEKFYSNGLDLDWRNVPADHPQAGDPEAFMFMKVL